MSDAPAAIDKILRPARPTPWQLIMLLLSIYVLLALVTELALDEAQYPESVALLRRLDNWICVVFLGDFFYRLWKAPRKLEFLKWNWIDFISSIPAVESLRVGRLVRVFRVLRALRSAKWIASYVFKSKGGGVASAAALSFIFVTFAAIAILSIERSPESNIKTPADALWWAAATITTVGYGDRYPVTPEGRVVAVFLMVAGAGIFGIMSGAVASMFLESDREASIDDMTNLKAQLTQLHDQIQFLQNKMSEEDEIVRLADEIRELRTALLEKDSPPLAGNAAGTAAGDV